MTSLGKIAVVGSGSIGLYYGSKLAAAGQEVHFLMRSDLESARQRGVRIRSDVEEDIELSRVNAHADTTEIGPCDLVLIGLKTTSNDVLEQLLQPLVKDNTALLTLQNGLGSDEELAGLFGSERVMGGLCFICLTRVEPGVVEHYGHGVISIGEFQGSPGERTRRMADAFGEAGVKAIIAEDLAKERWRKLVWNIPFNGLSIAAGGATVDVILADAGLEKLARGLMGEVIAGARAVGHAIPPEFANFQIERSLTMGAYKPSSLVDWLAKRPVEVEAIWGEPLRRAQAAGAELPRLEMLYHILRSVT